MSRSEKRVQKPADKFSRSLDGSMRRRIRWLEQNNGSYRHTK